MDADTMTPFWLRHTKMDGHSKRSSTA